MAIYSSILAWKNPWTVDSGRLQSIIHDLTEEQQQRVLGTSGERKLYMEQQPGSKLGKDYVNAVYCYPAYLNSMQSTSCKMLGWVKHKSESGLLVELSITSDMQMTPPLWQKVKRN